MRAPRFNYRAELLRNAAARSLSRESTLFCERTETRRFYRCLKKPHKGSNDASSVDLTALERRRGLVARSQTIKQRDQLPSFCHNATNLSSNLSTQSLHEMCVSFAGTLRELLRGACCAEGCRFQPFGATAPRRSVFGSSPESRRIGHQHPNMRGNLRVPQRLENRPPKS